MLPISSNSNSSNNNNNSKGSSLKRSSSMIFRIEHLLPSSSTITTTMEDKFVTTSHNSDEMELKLSKRNKQMSISRMELIGVFVSQFTPKGTLSENMAAVTLMSTSTSSLEIEERIYCHISEGILCMSANILRRIKLSEDIHSYNALFELHKGQVRLRLVQDLHEGEEIVAWFCEQMSMLMSIPFLTLHNIQGDKLYTCHVCQQNFETPHPLKLHLALNCDRNSIDILFIRLYYATTFNQQQQILNNTMPAISMSLPMQVTESSTIVFNYSPNRSQHTISPTNAERYSAFRPIKSATASLMVPTSASTPIFTTASSTVTTTQLSTGISGQTSSSLLNNVAPRNMSFLPQLSTADLNILHTPTSTSLNAAAQIEAIVSNMGASKGGHLCLYCGKCYSRKYGLKIHIRTHTGFKPLKCKFCLRPFGDPSNLNKHVRLHLQANAITMRSEVHKCHLCHKALARRRDLQRHLESRHAVKTTTSTPSSP